ncbi:kelch-like protein 7 isoform X2 [Archocentrus centrarchus]|uniref:kelch-like protein 7 isoform X2 n=1 Tax=Archocentrus centrarchus TaxID=63155 RepID=UPI0011E9C280|nr:kelch-like protein 7 isoform X2 [Archocentrus centrarchus]
MDSPLSTETKSTTRECTWLASNTEFFNSLRKQGIFCDVTLVVQGKYFPAHRIVLAAASHVFRLMFTTKMKESVCPEVELRSVEPEIIELLLEYIYTSQISVDRNNVQLLLNVANQYQIEPVKTLCVKFINGQIDATNCLGISALADYMNCPELQMAAEEFVQLHFVDVCRLDEFLQLDIAQLTHLLHQDKLSVCSETQVYDAAVRWLKYNISNRQQHVAEVLRCVRLPLVSKTFLSETVKTEPLFKDNPDCLQMITCAMCKNLRSREDLGKGSQPRRKKHNHCIGLFEGPHGFYFDPRDSSWMSISCHFAKRQNTTAVVWNGVVYILGGSNKFPIKHTDCYNILENSWYSKPGPTPRDSMAACAFEGKIYTSGGSKVGALALDLFESYDTVTESWQVNTSMLVSRCSHGSVEANGLIYVCGGMAGTGVSGRVLRNCEVYDPSAQQWRTLHEMRVARKNHGLVVVNNRIYAVGGQGSTGGLDSVEYYDIASNKWHAVSRMPWRGLNVKCAAVGDVIYVVAGKGLGAQCLRNVLEYHTQSDRWVTSKAQAFASTSCVICMVDP